MGPAIIVFPDCFTALGGNQYLNSSAIGDYGSIIHGMKYAKYWGAIAEHSGGHVAGVICSGTMARGGADTGERI
jgi:hypothetical protein